MAESLRAYNNEWLAQLLGTPQGLPGIRSGVCFAQQSAHNATTNRAYICRGHVLDAIASTYCYRVALENAGGIWPCIAGVSSSVVAFGSKEVTTISPGNNVWVLKHPGLTYGVIFCVEPAFATSPDLCRNDQIHQSSRCGIQVDGAHYKLFEGSGGIPDASAGRPLDSLPIGETGWQAETGLRIWQDSFMSQLGVDEACGVFAFYHDQLLRVAGTNLQEFSAQHVRQLLDDIGESFAIEGFAIYPWEQYGAFKPNKDALRELSAAETQTQQQHYSAQEPKFDDQLPYHRLQHFGGYLGQGGKRALSVPPQGGELNRLSSTTNPQGVFEEQLGLHGGWSMRSAKGILIAKRPAIPHPVQRKAPEDPTGDTSENYRPSGQYGSGPQHQIKGQVELSGGAPQAAQMAAGVLDLMAFTFAWDGMHPFEYHKTDWDVQTETETELETNQELIDFSQLQSSFYLNPPEPRTLEVDHRYGVVQYYPNTSFLALQDNGNAILADGFGSTVSLFGGHIMLDAAADIWLKAGRNVNIWAGGDIVMRAKNSIDVSTTDKDIRIKAEKNLHVIGGAAGAGGGILLEAPTPSVYQFTGKEGEEIVSGGIILKAKQGAIAGLAKDIYLRTGGGDVQAGGVFMLDANKGQDQLFIQAASLQKFLTNSEVTHFGRDGKISKTLLATPTGLSVNGNIEFNGSLAGKGLIALDGSMYILTGGIGFEKDAKEALGTMKPANVTKLREQFKAVADAFTSNNNTGATTYNTLKPKLYEDERIGNPETISSIKFKFRNTTQYKTTNAAIFESYWQQLAREGGSGGTPWTEKACNETWPYPGQEAFQSSGFYTQSLTMYDVPGGISKDPATAGSSFKEPRLTAGAAVGLNSGYIVTGA